VYYGVREFGMAAIANGIALHGGLIPYGATFLMFSEYARNALRMAALMKQRQIHRLHPRLHRPRRRRPDPPAGRADRQPAHHPEHGRLAPGRHHRNRHRLDRRDRTGTARALRLSRQNLPTRSRSDADADIRRGGYVLSEAKAHRRPQAVIIATGSEVKLALGPGAAGRRRHCRARGVHAQHQRLRPPGCRLPRSVLPAACPASPSKPASATAGASTSACDGAVIGIDRFGESAPAGELFEVFGFTVEAVVKPPRTVA
jgi:transketolase